MSTSDLICNELLILLATKLCKAKILTVPNASLHIYAPTFVAEALHHITNVQALKCLPITKQTGKSSWTSMMLLLLRLCPSII